MRNSNLAGGFALYQGHQANLQIFLTESLCRHKNRIGEIAFERFLPSNGQEYSVGTDRFESG